MCLVLNDHPFHFKASIDFLKVGKDLIADEDVISIFLEIGFEDVVRIFFRRKWVNGEIPGEFDELGAIKGPWVCSSIVLFLNDLTLIS